VLLEKLPKALTRFSSSAEVIEQLADEGYVVGLALGHLSFEPTSIPDQERAGPGAAGPLVAAPCRAKTTGAGFFGS